MICNFSFSDLMQKTQTVGKLTGRVWENRIQEEKNHIPELLSNPVSPFPLIIFNGTTESEIVTNISHYLRDDQRYAKLWIFKHAALTVLTSSQPQPSMGQEISLQVARGNCGIMKLQQLCPICRERELKNCSTSNQRLSFFGDRTHTEYYSVHYSILLQVRKVGEGDI